MAPRKLWKTTIVIWTEEDAQKISPGRLVLLAETGDGYMSRCSSALIDNPYVQEDGPPVEAFQRGEPS